jgi:hypothetical protein
MVYQMKTGGLSLCIVIVAGLVFLTFGLYAGLRPHIAEAYEEKTLADENTFKQEIAQAGLAFVMYNNWKLWSDTKNTEKGESFFETLKSEFGDQVDVYIKVDIGNMSIDALNKIIRDIRKRTFPSFVLYMNGKIVNNGAPNAIRLNGAPIDKRGTEAALQYIVRNANMVRRR